MSLINLPDSRHAVVSSRTEVSWAGSFGRHTVEIRVGVRRSRTRRTAKMIGKAADEDRAGPGLTYPGLAWLPQKPVSERTPDAEVPRGLYHCALAEGRTPPGVPDPPPIAESTAVASFWNSLSLEEKRAFRTLAGKRVFAAGARLMQEGEHANHVAVILDGWTEIRVREHDGERVVARRGPGQLVGERAALQVSVRSATVVAIQPVEALVMHTEDFAAFVSGHPGVLDIVENQIFSRLRERTAGYEEAGYASNGSSRPAAGWVAPGRPDNRARPAGPRPRRRLTGENCTVLRTDVVAFSAEDRNDEDRAIIRRATMAMTHQALGTTRDLCWCEDRGDGHLIVAPPSIPTARAMQGLLAGLVSELRRHNRIYSNSIQVRLRVAVDVGPVTEDVSGVSGKAIITASRMLDAPAFKEAMAEDGAVLGVVVSPFVYENAIRQGAGPSTVTGYRKIMVEVKETRAPAWIHLIAGQLGQVQLATSGASSPCSRV